ncbi:hypothetical protein ACOSP7_021586 [Xanthoceras sorbifolium]
MHCLKKGALLINDYVLKMKGFSEALGAAGQAMSNDDLILSILGGLGAEYDSVVVAITTKQGYFSFRGFNPQGNRGRGKNVGRGRGRTGGRNGRFFCQLCGKTGHTVTVCYHRFDRNFQGVNNNQQQQQFGQQQGGFQAHVHQAGQNQVFNYLAQGQFQ